MNTNDNSSTVGPTHEDVVLMYAHIFDQEAHFNRFESTYRKLASSLMVLVATAVGLCLTTKSADFLVRPELMIAILCLIGVFGLLLLWTLDLRHYHPMVDACFLVGLDLEDKYEWLPQIRNTMRQSSNAGITPVVWFYAVSVLLCGLGAIAATTVTFCYDHQSKIWLADSRWVLPVLVLVVVGGSVVWVFVASKNPSLRRHTH